MCVYSSLTISEFLCFLFKNIQFLLDLLFLLFLQLFILYGILLSASFFSPLLLLWVRMSGLCLGWFVHLVGFLETVIVRKGKEVNNRLSTKAEDEEATPYLEC